MALIVSVSGIRGIVGQDLTSEVASRFAWVFASHYPGRIGLGSDSRPSGIEIKRAITEGLTESGCDALDFGILPTPTFGWLVRECQLNGGIQVTASHNPAPYNGLKLFGPDGAVLSAKEGEVVKAAFESFQRATTHSRNRGSQSTDFLSSNRYLSSVESLINKSDIRKSSFRVVLDANGGAGGPLASGFLESLGCQITPIACDPDGKFLHEPEPTPDNLRSIEAVVRNKVGSVGACLDPDADRLVMIDETGNCLSEELTLALAIQSRLRKARGPIVINLSTSRVTEDVAKATGVACYRSAVGEANVVAKMREVNALIGGEGNGGVIDPRIGWVRDPFIGMGLILEMMAETRTALSELATALPKYVIVKDKICMPPEMLPKVFAAIVASESVDLKVDQTDGLRVDWPDHWIQVRGSNTEPVVRLIAEARDEKTARNACETARQLIQSVVSSKS